jgi:hypothetical protein
MRRTTTALAAALTMALAVAGPAAAHEGGGQGGGPVAPSGTPSCFGLRTSHAASQHGLDPDAKADNIQWWIDETDLFDDLLVPWYGETVEVREVQAWVRMMCGTGRG